MTRSARIRAQRQAALYEQDRASRVSPLAGSSGHGIPVSAPSPQGAGANGPAGGVRFHGETSLDEAHLRARTSDPVSSHRAAQAITRSGRAAAQQREVLDALRRFDGSTSRELAQLSGIDRYVCARRLPEIERKGWVRRYACEGDDVRWFVAQPVQPAEVIRNPLLT